MIGRLTHGQMTKDVITAYFCQTFQAILIAAIRTLQGSSTEGWIRCTTLTTGHFIPCFLATLITSLIPVFHQTEDTCSRGTPTSHLELSFGIFAEETQNYHSKKSPKVSLAVRFQDAVDLLFLEALPLVCRFGTLAKLMTGKPEGTQTPN